MARADTGTEASFGGSTDRRQRPAQHCVEAPRSLDDPQRRGPAAPHLFQEVLVRVARRPASREGLADEGGRTEQGAF